MKKKWEKMPEIAYRPFASIVLSYSYFMLKRLV